MIISIEDDIITIKTSSSDIFKIKVNVNTLDISGIKPRGCFDENDSGTIGIKSMDNGKVKLTVIWHDGSILQKEHNNEMIIVDHVHKKEPCKNCIDIYIGRPSILSNPFPITSYDNRKESLRKFKIYLKQQIILRTKVYHELRRIQILEEKNPNKIIRLLCFCKPLPCHGDILVQKLETKMLF